MNAKAHLNRYLAVARRALARSTPATRLAVAARNQLNGIIAEHLGHDTDMSRNGEAWIIQQLAPGTHTFIDVGANTGDWSALYLQHAPGSSGWLFDPSSSAIETLQMRFREDPRVRLIQAALSDHEGTMTFYEEPAAGHTSSLVRGFSTDAQPRIVTTTTLDAFVRKEALSVVDFLKIDAEGYDLHVLRGAVESLRAGVFRAIQFEYNLPWQAAGSTLQDALTLLRETGHSTFLLKGARLYRFPYSVYGDFYHYSNFVAVPLARVDSIAHLCDRVI